MYIYTTQSVLHYVQQIVLSEYTIYKFSIITAMFQWLYKSPNTTQNLVLFLSSLATLLKTAC